MCDVQGVPPSIEVGISFHQKKITTNNIQHAQHQMSIRKDLWLAVAPLNHLADARYNPQ